MSLKAQFARVTRAASVVLLLACAVAAAPAFAQALSGPTKTPPPASADLPPPAPAPPILHISVKGTQRIESGTVLSYISLREGAPFTPPLSPPPPHGVRSPAR